MIDLKPRGSRPALFLALALGAPGVLEAQSDLNPRGFIIDRAWLALGPFQCPDFTTFQANEGGCLGSDEDLLREYLWPTPVGTLTPAEGEEVEYDPARAAASAYEGPLGPRGRPQWRLLEDRSGDGDLDLGGDAAAAGRTAVGIMTYLATYLLYLGEGPAQVDLCVGSDDGVQVWIDNQLVHNLNVCRERSPCQDRLPVTVAPGEHRILMGVWQREFNFGASLGLEDEGIPITDGSEDWLFLGAERPPGFALTSQSFLRTVTGVGDSHACPPANGGPLTVAITAILPDGPPLAVVPIVRERISGSFGPEKVTALGPEGVQPRIDPIPLEPSLGPRGIFEDARVLIVRPRCPGGNGEVVYRPADESYTLTNIGQGIWTPGDSFTFAYRRVEGDFTLSARVLDRRVAPGAIAGHFGGLLARQDLSTRSRYAMVSGAEAHPTHFEGRLTPGGSDDLVYGGSRGENFLRIERRGEVLLGFASQSGEEGTYLMLGEVRWKDAPASVLVGLAANSHTLDCALGPAWVVYDQGRFDLRGARVLPPDPPDPIGAVITWSEVPLGALEEGLRYRLELEEREGIARFSGSASLPAGDLAITGDSLGAVLRPLPDFGPFTDPDFPHAHAIGAPCPGSEVTRPSPGTLRIHASARDIWWYGDRLVFAYRPVSGDFSARVTIAERRFVPGSQYATLGILAREDCSPRSRYSSTLDSGEYPKDPTRFIFRATHGGGDNRETIPPVEDHASVLRLDRCGNTFIGYVLSEQLGGGAPPEQGTFRGKPGEWVELGRHDWGPGSPETVQLGLGATSGPAGPVPCASFVTHTFKDWRVTAGCGQPPPARFARGDANADGTVDLSDPLRVLGYLFLGDGPPQCEDAADADDSGGPSPDLTDIVSILSWLFLGGAPPPAPGPGCGPDPTPDILDCFHAPACG
jgi:hypothetical protein